jgi:hypothetical protein
MSCSLRRAVLQGIKLLLVSTLFLASSLIARVPSYQNSRFEILFHAMNGLKPGDYLCTTNFNIKKFFMLPNIVSVCVLCGSQNEQGLFPYTALTGCFV